MGKVSLDPQSALAQRLRYLRSAKKLKQVDVATAVNISSRTYSNYERAYRMPDLRILTSLADFFNVSTDYLLGRTTLRYRYPKDKKALTNFINGNEAVLRVADSQLDNKALYDRNLFEDDQEETADN
ncbi:MAG: helix-turn-helix transcriptional regulator [Clostridiaceae bacterium]|jgi:transcriptional regulator with XRE-family HTH domain|nr:helix-turn-helix transcriptional regulator [Clostridiaceae bacterium]